MIVALVLLRPYAIAQSQQVTFVPVAPEDLSSSFVRCIYKDSKGFMWFGTTTGLIRHDGTTVRRYEHVDGNNKTILENRINVIIEDNSGNLWIGTAQGVAIYNRDKDNFSNVDSIAGNSNHLNNKYITSLCKDREGRIWIGTHGQGINVYDPKTFTFAYLKKRDADSKDHPDNYITSLCNLDDKVWAGTKGGMRLFNTHDLQDAPMPVTDKSLTLTEIMQIEADAAGNMWVANADREIIKLTPEGAYVRVQKNPVTCRALTETGGNILSLAIDAKGNVWMGGENSGLNYLDVRTNRIICHEAEEDNPRKLPTNSIRCVYVDDTGITWIGTYNAGVYMIDNNAKKFESYQHSEFIKGGLRGRDVRDIAEDKDGNIWIACDGGGLGKLDTRNHEIQYDKQINVKLGTRYISALHFDKAGNLWVGTWGKGVCKVNLKSREVQRYKIESSGFGDNKVSCLYEDSRKTIWAGSLGSGLFYFDPKVARFIPLNKERKPDYISKSAYVTSILEDSGGALWIGTLFRLYRLNFSHADVYNVTVFEKKSEPGSIGSNDIQTIYEDTAKNLWVGTGDNGIAFLPYGGSTFKNIQRPNGLASNVVRGILMDSKGNLWISGNKGLSKYDATANSASSYTKEDGLPSNEFKSHACLIARDGKFYFGTDRGLLSFFPDSIRSNPSKPIVYLADLKLNNQSAQVDSKGSPLTKHISLTSAIELPFNQRLFAIDFMSINYGQSSRNQYCYKLEDFDDDWNCVGSNNRATYTNIGPGHYVFLVKASTSDGVLSDVPARLEITIHQAPWKTWWALLSYLVVVSFVIYFLFRVRIERIKIRNQLELERLAHEKEHALSESKTQFFTNISHEFRTPLSLISMPLESLIAMDNLPSAVKERLGTIHASADKMTRLVNELMDFNKLEGAKLKLRVQHGELVQFITEVASVFYDLAAKRNIHFGIHSMLSSLEGWFDRGKLEKIIVNLLSNAFKFIADRGQINIIIATKQLPYGDGQMVSRFLELVVVDNGIGIPIEELPFIFDKFYQARSSEQVANPGTGIGLFLTKGLVELHHGTINAESSPGTETKFLIHLPIDRQIYGDGDICESPGYIVTQDNTPVTPNVLSVIDPGLDEDRDKAHILIVEDNDELRKYITTELRQQFMVVEAKNGEEGLAIATERSPDLIISDILMPVKSGIELCREIKSNVKTSHIPFILLTAKAMVNDQIVGIASGADVYITKPFSIRVLIAHVNQIIESRQKLYSRFSQDVYLLPAKVATNEIDEVFLQRAINYIVDNIQDSQLGVDSIAGIFHLSRMQVYRKIKALTGKSVVEFIRMVRVKQALKLMDTHKHTLQEIAYQTGFNSPSYFTRVFKEEYGKTPSEYLENQI
jgi:signal transduction histidine kinase/ligand-binding sensor domain-containing protein/CheY-like chemotaxis protein/AraC-like DNA-binding protein